MMKVLYGMFSQETNAFSVEETDFKRLTVEGWYEGEQVTLTYRGTDTYLGGILEVAAQNGIEVIPTVAVATAGPMLTKPCLDRVVDQIVAAAREHKDEISGVCLSLHGAGVGIGVPSIEVYTLKALRKVLGDDMPVMVSLDLHANISAELLSMTDGIFGIKEYPHIDTKAAGMLSMQCLINVMEQKACYYKYLVKLPLLIPCLGGSTFQEPMKSIKEYIGEYKRINRLTDATLFHGFPYSDQPHTGASIVVISDRPAEKEAMELAQYVWDRRESVMPRSIQVGEAVDMALAEVKERGYTVIAETSDNAGGGAPANGTHLLRELVKRSTPDFPRCIFGAIYDPEVAKIANAAGVGAHISVKIGGFTDQIHGEPLEVEDAEVLALSNGKSTFLTPVLGEVPCDLGICARLRIKSLDVIIISAQMQTFDDRPFLLTGADINQYAIVALKSTHHFRGWFEQRANSIVVADPPGIQTANFKILPFRNIVSPVYPLCDKFDPQLTVREIPKA